MDDVITNKTLKLDAKGVGTLMYNMGLNNLKNSIVNNVVEKHLYLLKDNFTPRVGFGALYGSIKCDASNYFI